MMIESSRQEVHLIADRFRADPRVAEARQLLLSALRDHQSALVGSQPAVPELQSAYEEQLGRLAEARGGKTYFPYLASGIGNGPWVELADGSVKLDFISGIGVHGLGHSHPLMLEASIDAALEDTVMQGNLQQHRPTIELSEHLLRLANAQGANLEHCLLSTSGAMANENALKIAFHNRAPADRVLAFDNCFAGRSIAMAQLTDRPQYRTGIPTALAVDYIPSLDAEQSAESQTRALNALDKQLKRYPGKYAAIWMELVSGEGGYYPGTTEFFQRLAERARQDNILVVADEVQTFGRLSRPFAFQSFSIDHYVDITTVGKITQLCATLYRAELKPTGPLLSQTFTAASSSIAAAEIVLRTLSDSNCFGDQGENVKRHDYFAQRLGELAGKYPGKIGGPYGCGMMVAFTPGDGTADTANKMVHAMFAAGLMGFVAGANPSRIRFLPPPAVTQREHIDAAIRIIEAVASATPSAN